MSVRSRRDFGHNIQERRAKKKANSRAEREKAEANIAANTADAQMLFDRDYGRSALETMGADPLDVLAQRQAIDRFGEMSRDGYTSLDRQAMDQAMRRAGQFEQSQRMGVMDAAARRGDTSGGTALMGALAAQQGGADRASEAGTNIALEGRRRAMEALAQGGQMAGQKRSQDMQRGGALDAFSQWSAGQRSSDAAQLANARSGQAQYQLGRADQLAPWKPGDIAQKVFDTGATAVQTYVGATSGGSGGGSGGGGGGTAKSMNLGPGQNQAHELQSHAGGTRWNPVTQRWE